jgi:hypothetical protein
MLKVGTDLRHNPNRKLHENYENPRPVVNRPPSLYLGLISVCDNNQTRGNNMFKSAQITPKICSSNRNRMHPHGNNLRYRKQLNFLRRFGLFVVQITVILKSYQPEITQSSAV